VWLERLATNALLVNARGVVSLGATFGVQPVAIDGTYAYIVRSPQKYDRINLLNGETQSLPHGIPGSSQGIRDVVNGEIRWADNTHFGTFGGLVLHDYSTRGASRSGSAIRIRSRASSTASVHGDPQRRVRAARRCRGRAATPSARVRPKAPRSRSYRRIPRSTGRRSHRRRPLHLHHHDRSRHPCLTFPLL
jgi:hypothetical protein